MYNSQAERRLASARNKLEPDLGSNLYFKSIPPTRRNKTIITLPAPGPKTKQVITTAGHKPQFILEYHSFNSPTVEFMTLSTIVEGLYQLAQYRQPIHPGNMLNGQMRAIGFRAASDSGKKAGMCFNMSRRTYEFKFD